MAPICDYGEPNYWFYTMILAPSSKVTPLDIVEALEREDIESRPVWKPMNLQTVYKKYPFYNHYDDDILVAEDVLNRGVCLPSDTKMSSEDMDRVIEIVGGLWR